MNNFTKKIYTWVVWNSIWVALIVFGAFMANVYAGNVLLFLLWLNLLSAFGWTVVKKHDRGAADRIVKKFEGVPSGYHNFSCWWDIGMSAALAAAGWYWMAGILTFSAFTELQGKKDLGLTD